MRAARRLAKDRVALLTRALAHVIAFVDEIVLVGDDDLRAAQRLNADALGVLVEPAGAAGIAALARHGDWLPGGRTAFLLTGAGRWMGPR